MKRAVRAQLRKDLAWVRKNVSNVRDALWPAKFTGIATALEQRRITAEELKMTSPDELDQLLRARAYAEARGH